MRCSRIVLLLLPFVHLEAAVAQESGAEFTGIVRGPDRNALPGATITIRNIDTGVGVTVVCGAQGIYRAPGLQAGSYELKAELQSFEPTITPMISLHTGETKTVDFTLPIAAIKEIITVVGTAPADSVESVQVRESSARDIGEAMSEAAGTWKLRKGGIANDIVVRGFQAKDLNVLIDGQRIYGACPNHMDPPAFHADFSEVERIELQKGPFDVRNQGSLGGVVNIVTRRPEQGFHASGNLFAGSFGFVNPSATASYASPKFSVLGGYSFRLSQPYTDASGRRFTEYVNYSTDSLDSRAFSAGTAWGKFSVAPARNQSLQLAYSHQQSDHILYPYLQMDAVYDNADRVNFAYRIDGLTGPVDSIRFQGYFTRVNHWMTDQYRVSSVGLAREYSMGTMAETRTFGGRIEAAPHGVTVGLETYRRQWDTVTMMAGSSYQPQYSIPDVKSDSLGVYAAYQEPLSDRVKLDLGGRIDWARSVADQSKANIGLYYAYNSTRLTAVSDTLPSGNVRLSYSTPHGFEFSGGIGHTSRLPEPEERYLALRRMGSDWVGNPTLAPSRNTGVDGVFSFRHHGLFLNSSLYFDNLTDFITVNNQRKQNMVAGIMNSVARSYQNVDAHMYGGEMQVAYSVTRRVFLSGDLSYVRATQEPDPLLNIYSKYLPEIPPLRSRASLRYDRQVIFAEVEGIFVAPQKRVDSDLGELPGAGYGTANIKFGANFRRFALRGGMNNVFNRPYYEFLSYQRDPFRNGSRVFEPGRNVYVNLSYRF